MNIWLIIVLVVAVLYVLDRLTTTTDLPVSARLARARAIVEAGRRRRDRAAVSAPRRDAADDAASSADPPDRRAA